MKFSILRLFTLAASVSLCACSQHSLREGSSLSAVEGGECPAPSKIINRAFAREMLTGSWQGVRAFSKGGRYEWITHHYSDGTYRSVFREPGSNDEKKDKVEVGFWGVSGMVRYMLFRGWETKEGFIAAPPDEPTYYDTFLLQRLDEEQMLYCNLETGEQYQAVRVKHGSEFSPL
jgi:hypothetical protein